MNHNFLSSTTLSWFSILYQQQWPLLCPSKHPTGFCFKPLHLLFPIPGRFSKFFTFLLSSFRFVLPGFSGDSAVKNLPKNAGDAGLIPGLGRSPREENGNPLQYSCLGNSTDKGAWWATVHGVTKESETIQGQNNNTASSEQSFLNNPYPLAPSNVSPHYIQSSLQQKNHIKIFMFLILSFSCISQYPTLPWKEISMWKGILSCS